VAIAAAAIADDSLIFHWSLSGRRSRLNSKKTIDAIGYAADQCSAEQPHDQEGKWVTGMWENQSICL
jgi:hypothetical protein